MKVGIINFFEKWSMVISLDNGESVGLNPLYFIPLETINSLD